jgi:flavodoxin
MTQIGLFFGSSTGNTAAAADLIVEAFQEIPGVTVDLYVGLALDDSQIDQAGEIVAQWVAQLAAEFMLEAEFA